MFCRQRKGVLANHVSVNRNCPDEYYVFLHANNTNATGDVKFRLYTRKNPENYEFLTTREDILKSRYNTSVKTVFIAHGYTATPNDEWLLMMKTLLLSHSDYNVIIVDWQRGAHMYYNPFAIIHSFATGKEVARMVKLIIEATEGTLGLFHLIGFGLGAQVVGFAGKHLKNVARITALDPEGLCFVNYSPEHHIHRTDARFVDVISTNAGGYGILKPVGAIQHLVNGGRSQVACGDKAISESGGLTQRVLNSCSHARAPLVFMESIMNQKCSMVGYSCENYQRFIEGECADCGKDGTMCGLMGIDSDKQIPNLSDETRVYYLNSSDRFPFCMYHYQIRLKITATDEGRVQNGRLMVAFDATEDTFQSLKTSGTETLRPGGIYNYLITSSKNIAPVKSIRFTWFRIDAGVTTNSKLYVNCMKIIPMNNLFTDRSTVSWSYSRDKYRAVVPGEVITLHQTQVACD